MAEKEFNVLDPSLEAIEQKINSLIAGGVSDEPILDILKDIVAYIKHSEKVLDDFDYDSNPEGINDGTEG